MVNSNSQINISQGEVVDKAKPFRCKSNVLETTRPSIEYQIAVEKKWHVKKKMR